MPIETIKQAKLQDALIWKIIILVINLLQHLLATTP